MEKITEFVNMRKLIHRVYCDECKVELETDNIVLTTYPPQYPYHCPKCGKRYVFRKTYPWTEILGDEIEYEAPVIEVSEPVVENKIDSQITITCDSNTVSLHNSDVNINGISASSTMVCY